MLGGQGSAEAKSGKADVPQSEHEAPIIKEEKGGRDDALKNLILRD